MINLMQAQRDALIAHCKSSIEHLEFKKKTWGAVWAKFLDLEILSHKITLYSLEAEPVGFEIQHEIGLVSANTARIARMRGFKTRAHYLAPPVCFDTLTVDDIKPGGRLFEYIEAIPREELQKFINGEF